MCFFFFLLQFLSFSLRISIRNCIWFSCFLIACGFFASIGYRSFARWFIHFDLLFALKCACFFLSFFFLFFLHSPFFLSLLSLFSSFFILFVLLFLYLVVVFFCSFCLVPFFPVFVFFG